MIDWRTRMQARRRARRRYLAVAFEHWRAQGVPAPTHGRTRQVLVTLLWLLAPGLLALVCCAVLLVARDGTPPVEVHPSVGLLVVPMLLLWLLRGSVRR
ncbi:MAG: hypothetical protein JOZ81_14250 [Chloroflexi bacterium]|nr:hypothetical protein [Chloroflexota bacterium]